MGIILDVEDYCSNCPDFEAEYESYDFRNDENHYIRTTIVSCVNKERCKCMFKYLEDRLRKEEERRVE